MIKMVAHGGRAPHAMTSLVGESAASEREMFAEGAVTHLAQIGRGRRRCAARCGSLFSAQIFCARLEIAILGWMVARCARVDGGQGRPPY
jgi:hypothetical protein